MKFHVTLADWYLLYMQSQCRIVKWTVFKYIKNSDGQTVTESLQATINVRLKTVQITMDASYGELRYTVDINY